MTNSKLHRILTVLKTKKSKAVLVMTNDLHKCASKVVTWWKVTNIPPQTDQLHKMLISAFGCFAIALFLLLLFDPKKEDSTYLLCLSFISLLLAFVLLSAIPLSNRLQVLYTCARLLDGKFIVIWVFMFSPIMALKRLIDVLTNVLKNTFPEAYRIGITTMLAASGIFFIGYFVISIWLTYRKEREQPYTKYREFLFTIAATFLFFTGMLILLADIWPKQFQMEPYGYVIPLMVATIFLIKCINSIQNQKCWLCASLGTAIASIISLIAGYVFSGYPLWLWFCFGLIVISFFLAVIGILIFDHKNKT